ncbi:MAG: hypothetical protein WCK89_22180, partial [bacterium]
QMLEEGRFIREHAWGKTIRSTTTLHAMVLAENVHPLINRGVFAVLNKPFNGRIQFGFVKMADPEGVNFERVY